ncbi:MAG TPA: HAMP domain-containing sensor histidine kinase [Cyclobacteriaceae bacterium]|jgi:signal transduction histidine kinase|nr:HAMP domain-containing sensor histidine kinase [Cyclobacteriaceae bacterium]
MLEVLVIAFLLATVLVVFYILVRSRKDTQLMEEQSQMIEKHMLDLEESNRQLEDLNQEKLQLIGLVSHDLKGPFNRIFALVQLMNMSKDNLTEDQKDYLGKIQQISVDGLGMVRNLLDSRQLDESGIQLRPTSLDFAHVVTSLVKHYLTIAEKKKIEIDLKISGDTKIRADKNYLGRMVENLLSNAVKFSYENKKIECELIRRHETVEFSVKDEGPGISKEDQLKLFSRFQSLSAKPTAGESTTGLGLYIAKSIAEKMRAQILCESELGRGAKFILRMPVNSI